MTEALARLGFVVLVPYAEYVAQEFVAPDQTISSLVGAFSYLQR